jgi:hypothetical protein
MSLITQIVRIRWVLIPAFYTDYSTVFTQNPTTLRSGKIARLKRRMIRSLGKVYMPPVASRIVLIGPCSNTKVQGTNWMGAS